MIRYLLILLSVLFLTAFAVAAQAEQVNISADELNYYLENDLVIAKGNVVVTWGDFELFCDELSFNIKENYLKAVGRVVFFQGEYDFQSDEIVYYFEQEKAVILKPRGKMTDEDIDGFVYIYSDLISSQKGIITAESNLLTTCDLTKPHYYLRISRLEIVPGDVLRAWGVSFWEFSGRLPLFYWPYLAISLEERDQRLAPEFGYSAQRGFYIKTSYSYFLDRGYGHILFDVYSRTGLALGVRHFYLDRGNEQGSVYLYAQQDWANLGLPFMQGNWRHESSIGDNYSGRLNLAVDYFPENRINYSSSLSLRGTSFGIGTNLSSSISAVQNLDPQRDFWRSFDSDNRLRLDYSFLEGSRIVLDGRYETRLRENEDFLDQWRGSLRYTGGTRDLGYNLLLERRVPSLTSTSGSYLYTMPELKLNMRLGNLWGAELPFLRPFSAEILTGFYDEEASGARAFKLGGTLQYADNFRLWDGGSLAVNQEGRAYYYSTTDYFLVYNSRLRLSLQPFSNIRSTVTYAYTQPFGDSPFTFDSASLREALSLETRYTEGPWLITLGSGWDFVKNNFEDIVGNVRYSPSRELNLRLASGYSIANQNWRDVVLGADFRYEDFQLRSAYRFQPSPFTSKELTAQLNWQITPDVGISFVNAYDFTKDELKQMALQLQWDIHCRQLTFSYDHKKGEFWVQYNIFAFPEQRVKFGTSVNEPILFDIELGDLFDVSFE